MRHAIWVGIFAALLFGTPGALAGDGQERLNKEVRHLIQFVTESGCDFIRNGKTHTPAQAVEHINKKYAYFEAEIDSAEKFIELSATQSTLTGQKYTIRCPGQPVLESRAWLLRELDTFRKKDAR